MINEITASEAERIHEECESLTECFEMFFAQKTYIECLQMNDEFFLVKVFEFSDVFNASYVFQNDAPIPTSERYYKFPCVNDARAFAFQLLVAETISYE